LSRSLLAKISGVGGWTLLSRIAGFARDAVMAAILGAGAVADAFLVAFRLPNHFRAIFAEGAFTTAYVPVYSTLLEQEGAQAARQFSGQLLVLMLVMQCALLLLAWLGTPQLVGMLAPGLDDSGGRFTLAVQLTRITFPYLLCMSLLAVLVGSLNAHGRYAAGAAAPILLNVCMLLTLWAWTWFPGAGHAAAWGVLAAGFAELLLVAWAARRAGLLPQWQRPRYSAAMRRFLRALGPATLGSMGVQVALFADTIIASMLASGALSALYYADRINQLPIGVIGIAAGTVVLPEMARRLAAGDPAGAQSVQNRTMETTLLFALPCLAAFVCVPELIMAALFGRGAFDATAVTAAAATLVAYAVGLLPFVLVRSVVATFTARGDTRTPLIASLIGIAVNVLLKVMLMDAWAQVGLALATSIGAWVNVLLLVYLARRCDLLQVDRRLARMTVLLLLATALVTAWLWFASIPVQTWLRLHSIKFVQELSLLVLAVVSALLYFGTLYALRGRVLALR
jgi:putative peptidoglycan lipid II flippase